MAFVGGRDDDVFNGKFHVARLTKHCKEVTGTEVVSVTEWQWSSLSESVDSGSK